MFRLLAIIYFFVSVIPVTLHAGDGYRHKVGYEKITDDRALSLYKKNIQPIAVVGNSVAIYAAKEQIIKVIAGLTVAPLSPALPVAAPSSHIIGSASSLQEISSQINKEYLTDKKFIPVFI